MQIQPGLKFVFDCTDADFGPAKVPPTRFVVASGGVLFEGYQYGGPGVCLGDGQTETEGVTSQGGRGDALLPYLN